MGSNPFKKGLIAIIAMLSAYTIFAQTFTPKTVSITANCGGYYEYLPAGYSTSNENYPVIFYLHSAAVYGNGSATALKSLLTEGIPYYINNGKFPSSFTVKGETTSLIVIAPQFITKPSMADVKAVIDYISSKYRIDKARIYLTGHSVGGDATIKYPNTGITPAKQLAAIAASSAFNNPYVDSGAVYIAAANLPVRMYHSTDDTQAPYSWSQKFVNKINSYNPSVKASLILFSGYTHNLAWQREFDPGFRDSGYNVYEWLLSWRRDQAPVAVTGKDTSIIYPTNSVQLKGDASYDPDKDVITYSWRKLSGPAEFSINNASIANPLVSGLLPGVYTFQLTVTDPFAYTSSSSVTITVINPNPNILPVANAGGSQNIQWPINSVSLNGSASLDSDGVIESYNWKLFSGNPGFKISDTTASITTVSGLKPGNYKFLLTVTDNQGATSTDTASISVINLNANIPPVVNAGNDSTIYLPNNTFNLKASASDPDGQIISYKWKKLSGPASYALSDSTILNPTLTSLTEGTYQFSLSVKDDSSAITTDSVKLVVSAVQRILIDIGPVLTTNPDQWGKYWNNMTDGRAGIRVTNAITTLNQTTTVSLEVVNRIDGTYNTSATGLNSGNGTGIVGDYTSNATDDYAFSYEGTTNGKWRIFGLNPQSTYTIKFWGTRATTADRFIQIKRTTDSVWLSYNAANNKNANAAAVFTVSGVSEVSFDILTKTGSTYGYINIIDINVYNTASSSNQSPLAYAGADQILALPNNIGITLTGTASDPDGTIASTLWTQLTGPSATTVASNTSLSTTAKGFIAGNYSYELKVTDNSGAISRDTMLVQVLPPVIQSKVTVNAGTDQVITLPVDSAIVVGSVTDSGSIITTFKWVQVNGPSIANLLSADSLQTTINGLLQGQYIFRLKATDAFNNSDSSNVKITVNAAPAASIVHANAGVNQVITLPVNSIILSGSASDSGSVIASYLWTQVSGPSTSVIAHPDSVQTSVDNLVQGTYMFQLKVTDSLNNFALSTTQVIVNPVQVIGTTKFIKVQIYGGTGAYIDPQWNNWNVGSGSSSNSSSGTLKYSDGTVSAISGLLSSSLAVVDNNNTYATTISNTMCPAAVLRFTSYSGTSRTLTINGLNSAVKYSLEIYASRYSAGNTSIFTVNGVSVTITTYDNYTNKAAFSNIVPNAQGQIVVAIDKGSTYNYINGFTLTEQGGTNAITARNVQSGAPAEINTAAFEIYPNPIRNNCTVTLNNSFKGVVKATITNLNGVIVKQYSLIKNEVQKNWILPLPSVSKGMYIIQLEYDGYKLVRKVIKQ